jgi:hypothetical protein
MSVLATMDAIFSHESDSVFQLIMVTVHSLREEHKLQVSDDKFLRSYLNLQSFM